MLPHSNSNGLSGTPLQILHLMWCVSDVVLYFGSEQCQNKMEGGGGGGGGGNVLHEGDTH